MSTEQQGTDACRWNPVSSAARTDPEKPFGRMYIPRPSDNPMPLNSWGFHSHHVVQHAPFRANEPCGLSGPYTYTGPVLHTLGIAQQFHHV